MIRLIKLLEDYPIASSLMLRRVGVQSRDILAAEAEGIIVRPVSGLVVTREVFDDPDFDDALACSRTGGVIAHLSAAIRQQLCDALPPQLEMLVPMTVSRPPSGLPLKIYRTRDAENLTIGVESRPFHNWQIRITEPARTLIDLYRISPETTRQHAVAALAEYADQDLSTDRLHELADRFGVWETIRPELEAVHETRSRGMSL